MALTLVIAMTARAKIGDPPCLEVEGLTICSHADAISATRTSGGAEVWRTVLPAPAKAKALDPNLETDVQSTIISRMRIVADRIEAQFGGRTYVIALKTGVLLSPVAPRP